MKQVHKGITLSRTKTVNNILKIWLLAQPEDRYDWYAEAYNYALEISKLAPNLLNVNQSAGVIAALSPCKSWNQNKKEALKMIVTGDCGHIKAFKQKAAAIIASSGTEDEVLRILNGNKIQAFYLNMRYPEKSLHLTIDRHALSVCLNRWITEDDYRGMTKKQYLFFSECYRHAAAKLGISALLVQSATWLTWRKIKREFKSGVQLNINF